MVKPDSILTKARELILGRKYKEGDKLKIGFLYGYSDSYNQFKVIGLYDMYAWIQWANNLEIETMHLDQNNLKEIIILK